MQISKLLLKKETWIIDRAKNNLLLLSLKIPRERERLEMKPNNIFEIAVLIKIK